MTVGRSLILATLLCGAAVAVPAAQPAQAPAPANARRPLTHEDYDPWRSVAGQRLSPDGRWLAYSYMPQDGDGELVVRELSSGRERREPVGALPPPPVPRADEAPPDTPPPPRGIRLSFTADSRYLVASTYPAKAETDAAKKARKKPEDMPKQGLLIVDLGASASSRVANVKSYQVPAKSGSWVAFLREAAPDDKKADAGTPRPAESSAARPGARGAARKEYGTDLVLRDLTRGESSDRTFHSVTEYTIARDASALVYAVSSRTEDEDGVFAIVPSTAVAPAPLAAGKGTYAKLAWDREHTQLAFVSSRDDTASKTPAFSVYYWDRRAASASPIVSPATPGLAHGLVISDKGALDFSRDGRRLYVPTAPPPRAARDEEGEPSIEDKVVADLWHHQDDFVQPMQRVRAAQERNRTFRGVYHVDERRYVQVADATLPTVSFSDDGLRAIGHDDRPYRRQVDYDGSYSDAYLVDAKTGARRHVAKRLRGGGFAGGGFAGGGFSWAPDGRHAAVFRDGHWFVVDAASGEMRSRTASLGVSFADEDDDTPDPPSSYGQAGWTKDGQSFLANDRYDVWQLFADGRPAKNVTQGAGRASQTQFRVQAVEPRDEEDDERGIDATRPLYLRGVSETTRATGFFKTTFDASDAPQRLLWGDREYRVAGRARDADVLLLTASRFDEFPDLHVTDVSFRQPKKVTDGGGQMTRFLWGSAELVSFRNADGVPLRGALYKPGNFDPTKKYPLLVYIYERLSDGVHTFVAPAPGHSINTAYYVSNGYLVLRPDIVYSSVGPGRSALKCVLPAIDAVVQQGFVDESAIGIQGHSWGGYQIAYMLTQTSRFRAAEAGAPVGNMTSAYSGIRWGSGLPRQFQYEQTQSRIGKPLYDDPLKFLENSPVFHVKQVRTPLLILHNDADDAVPWYQGIELFLALRRTGKEAYLFNYNGEFHGLRRRHNQKDFAIRMQQFFDHYLKGAAKPEWMEKGIPYLDREEEKERLRRPTDGR